MDQSPLFAPESGLLRTYSGATFSPCRKYRTTLWRVWDTMPVINFCMLNPSDANEVDSDPTVTRCINRAKLWGFGGVVVTNIFSIVSSDPSILYSADDPIGPGNDEAIKACALYAEKVICAWGSHGKHIGRSVQVRKMLSPLKELYYLKISATTGEPYHPLYVAMSVEPKLWKD
jgi:hypothetical protein